MKRTNTLKRARDTARDELRGHILAESLSLLEGGGSEALRTRVLAERVGASTTMIYSLFGSKTGLVEALFRQGFEALGERFSSVGPSDDPLEEVLGICRAYREFALDQPAYYLVMFGAGFPELDPDEASVRTSWSTLQALIDALERCMRAGVLDAGDPVLIARSMWAAMHGVVSLEARRLYFETDQAEAIFDECIAALVERHRREAVSARQRAGRRASVGGRRSPD